MGFLAKAAYFASHPYYLGLLIQWHLFHKPSRNEAPETETAKSCFKFLDHSSRSFTLVINQLHPELRLPICIFYLILRGLDTIEDDPSIPDDVKESLLRGFSAHLDEDWTFTGNRAEEKDREVLVHFDVVTAEFRKLKGVYRGIIRDITLQMGTGMADYIVGREIGTVEEYDHYCWYVAGIVGEGLTQLFIETGFATETLRNEELYRSMGLMLQKNNIIRDVHEDYLEGRHFWPQQIWGKYVATFDDLFLMENREKALMCSSDMVLNALRHVPHCMVYLSKIQEKSVFMFCAVAQCMALATLEACFRNGRVFEESVRISRGQVMEVLVSCAEGRVWGICGMYVGRIKGRNGVEDGNFGAIRDACCEIEDVLDALEGEGDGYEDGDGGVKRMKRVVVVLVVLGVAWIMGWGR